MQMARLRADWLGSDRAIAIAGLVDSQRMAGPQVAIHAERVAGLAVWICRRLGRDAAFTERLRLAALVHDIGKHRLAQDLAAKPRPLSPQEFEIVKRHAALGRDLVANVDPDLAAIVLQHHERLDGSGYPMGLRRDEILPEAKILAVADVAEALMSDRPYRPALPMPQVVEVLRAERGVRLDAEAVDACCELLLEP
jgi:HD-GYP domain-containing protein (c-di-GMP phosphodiesterase class II)